MNTDPEAVSKAIVLWTGYGSRAWPSCDESQVVAVLGVQSAVDLMPLVRQLYDEFYESDASDTGADLVAMGDAALARFRRLHPEISEDAAEALAWCYTFDFK